MLKNKLCAFLLCMCATSVKAADNNAQEVGQNALVLASNSSWANGQQERVQARVAWLVSCMPSPTSMQYVFKCCRDLMRFYTSRQLPQEQKSTTERGSLWSIAVSFLSRNTHEVPKEQTPSQMTDAQETETEGNIEKCRDLIASKQNMFEKHIAEALQKNLKAFLEGKKTIESFLDVLGTIEATWYDGPRYVAKIDEFFKNCNVQSAQETASLAHTIFQDAALLKKVWNTEFFITLYKQLLLKMHAHDGLDNSKLENALKTSCSAIIDQHISAFLQQKQAAIRPRLTQEALDRGYTQETLEQAITNREKEIARRYEKDFKRPFQHMLTTLSASEQGKIETLIGLRSSDFFSRAIAWQEEYGSRKDAPIAQSLQGLVTLCPNMFDFHALLKDGMPAEQQSIAVQNLAIQSIQRHPTQGSSMY